MRGARRTPRPRRPDAGRDPLSVRRYRTSDQPTGQLWLVQGGPGGTVLRFDDILPAFAERSGGMDVYTVEHRGVGDSGRVGCPDQEDPASPSGTGFTVDELTPCLDAVRANHDLAMYTPTASARDLKWVMDRAAEPGQTTHVFGVSYGGLVVQRFASLFPDGADSLILDTPVGHRRGLVPMRWIANNDEVARELFDRCAADAQCLADVGGDPAARLRSVLVDVGTTCPELGGDARLLKRQMTSMLETPGVRDALPAFVTRLERCDPADVTAMQLALTARERLYTVPSHPDATAAESLFTLGTVITRTEWWEAQPPTLAEYQAGLDGALMAAGVNELVYPSVAAFESYAPDAWHEQLPTTDMPVLRMYGELDMRVPPSETVGLREAFSRPAQWSVGFANGTHAMHRVRADDGAVGTGCFWDLFEDFLAVPYATPDSACTADFEPIDFSGDATRAQQIFGTSDFYGPLSPRASRARLSHARAARPHRARPVPRRHAHRGAHPALRHPVRRDRLGSCRAPPAELRVGRVPGRPVRRHRPRWHGEHRAAVHLAVVHVARPARRRAGPHGPVAAAALPRALVRRCGAPAGGRALAGQGRRVDQRPRGPRVDRRNAR
ncbi:MAG: alpha/beta fold hydrolase [Deltaproteobacteria bacterium]|nr:MAG: alpha/beta fold hydrolase [Deltaproteobacteria bacterium]